MMRPEPQIQMAHDVLHAIVNGELPKIAIGKEDRDRMWLSLNALCWALGHDHGDRFGERLAAVMAAVKQAGYTLADTEGPQP